MNTTKTKQYRSNYGYEHKSRIEAQLHTSIRERYCLTNFFDALNVKFKYKRFECIESPIYKGCPYDATLKVYNKKGDLIGYSIIEAKVRENMQKDYFFEKKKKEALFKAKSEIDITLKMKDINLECEIMYINFLWNGVYVWDILDLNDKGYFNRGKRHMMNKETIVSREIKTLKSVYHLETNIGKFFTDFMFSNKSFITWYETRNQPQTKSIIDDKPKYKTFNLLDLFENK